MDVTYDDLQDRRILALEREVARLRQSIEAPLPPPLDAVGDPARRVEASELRSGAIERAPVAHTDPQGAGP